MPAKLSFSLLIVLLFVGCKFSPEKETNQASIHFSVNKMKDAIPSGLVSDGKEYHLFYHGKTDSVSTQWQQTSSVDLIHWDKPIKLSFPDSTGNINSASFVIDSNNTSGLGKDGHNALVAIYQVTSAQQSNSQFIAYSHDLGKTWTKYSENPVSLDIGNAYYKVSKIIWHEESQKWVLVLTGHDHVRFYSSDNLIDWQFSSTFSEVLDYISGEWDYADFFPLIAEGSNDTKWILQVSYNSGNPSSGAGTRSIIGDFNGYTFQPVHEKIKSVDYGSDNFAGVTCNINNDCYHIGCINNSTEANLPFNSKSFNSFTLPRKLSLSRNFNGFVVKSAPVGQINKLRAKTKMIAGSEFNGFIDVKEKQSVPYEINLTFNINKLQWLDFAEKFGIELADDNGDKLVVAYNHTKRVFFIERLFKAKDNQPVNAVPIDYAPYIDIDKTLHFRLIIDHSSVELFSDNGGVVMTEKIPQALVFNRFKIFAGAEKSLWKRVVSQA